ncbi:MAG: DUF3052 family protein [Alphaproteobacteria bacterium]|nr:MAG: DUF3052 family protein [Alphaproteobacteria bacterium]
MNAGVSPSLIEKLGLRNGHRAGWVGLPADLGALPLSRTLRRSDLVLRGRDLSPGPFDYIHIFSVSRAVLADDLAEARARLAPDGMIWVSWPKRAARWPTDITEDGIRALALEGPLVDVKVCAVNDVWSALKLVIRKGQR